MFDFRWLLLFDAIRGVNEVLRKPQPVLYIVAASTPLPSIGGCLAVPTDVTRTISQVACAACVSYGVCHSCAGRRVNECRFFGGCVLKSNNFKNALRTNADMNKRNVSADRLLLHETGC
jgi:hypothetical protein